MELKFDQRMQARDLYFQTKLTQQQIADKVGINRKTLYGWVNEGDWRHAKYTAAYAPSLLTDQYYEQLGMLNRSIAARENPWPTVEESRVIGRLASVIKQFKVSSTNIADAIDVFQAFITYLQREEGNYDAAKQFIEPMDRYMKKMLDKSSSIKYSKIAEEERAFQQEVANILGSLDDKNITIDTNAQNTTTATTEATIQIKDTTGTVEPNTPQPTGNEAADQNTDQQDTLAAAKEEEERNREHALGKGQFQTSDARSETPNATPPVAGPVYPSPMAAIYGGIKPGTLIIEGQEIPEFPGWQLAPLEYRQKYGVSKRRTINDLIDIKYSESAKKSSQNKHDGA